MKSLFSTTIKQLLIGTSLVLLVNTSSLAAAYHSEEAITDKLGEKQFSPYC